MSENTKIAWCDSTWNPWRGCRRVSPGCEKCYIVRTPPFRITGQQHWADRVRASDNVLAEPLRWNKRPWVCDGCGNPRLNRDTPCMVMVKGLDGGHEHCMSTAAHRRRVFSLSLGDWLDDEVPIEWLSHLLATIHATPNIDWLLLTKRPENFQVRVLHAGMEMMGYVDGQKSTKPEALPTVTEDCIESVLGWSKLETFPKNVWLGTSVENQKFADKRIPELLKIPAATRFISYEPALGPVDFSDWLYKVGCEPHCGDKCSKDIDCPMERSTAISQIIVGGESGPGARPFNIEWARSTIEQCQAAGLAAFCKQLGALPTTNHPDRDGWPHGAGFSLPVADQRIIRLKDKKGGNMLEWPEDMRVRQWPKGRP